MSQNPQHDPSGAQPPQQPAAKFDPAAPHQNKPRLRAIRGFMAMAQAPDGKQAPIMGLSDARQISEKVVMTVPAVQMILPLMDGSNDLDQIIQKVGRGLNRQFLEPLVAQLDDAGLIEGPTFEAMLARMRQEFDSSTHLPPGSTAAFADVLVKQAADAGEIAPDAPEAQRDELGARKLRAQLDAWMDEALRGEDDPAFDRLPKAIVAPHLDYGRGWENYALVYGRMRVADRPDRVVILGTNHFGVSTGVCLCDKGYRTPLGACDTDPQLIGALRSALGDALLENRYDHEREHSVELHIPWIQQVFGKGDDGAFPRVVGVLVHDPCVKNGESYDGRGVALRPFVDALRQAIATLPGRTLIVASADLSHVGPSFGDKEPLPEDSEEGVARRNKVFEHDREMLQHLVDRKPAELVSAMAWQKNPTRWCSIGNLVAASMAVDPAEVRLLNYAAAADPQGLTMVSSASLAMW
ncbi:MAG: AmmeMemoRadiSam system protein B [Phycisphaerae bacterium]|nr:AmmeMemoRadiSam system protein B [Phycisphaerae bacterium]